MKKKESSKSASSEDASASTTVSTPPSSTSSSSLTATKRSSLVTPNDETGESTSKRIKYTTNGENIPPTIESINTKLSQIQCDATKELLTHLTDESWRMKLADYVTRPSFMKLAKFVASERYVNEMNTWLNLVAALFQKDAFYVFVWFHINILLIPLFHYFLRH